MADLAATTFPWRLTMNALFRAIALVLLVSGAVLAFYGVAIAQATMTARLVDPEAKARQQAATVEVSTSGVELVDPAKANEKPVAGQGHLHYQLDKGAVIATPTPKLSFHGLTPGSHTIVVTLAGNDHKPLGPQQTVTVTVPAAATTAN